MSKFQKGKSGNPNGRPKGTIMHSTKVRDLLQSRSEELIETAIKLALGGDLAALKMCVERICPPLKPKDEYVGFGSFEDGLDAIKKCTALMAEGILSPNDVKAITQIVIQNMEFEEKVTEKENNPFRWA
jgi:hypothetical protein